MKQPTLLLLFALLVLVQLAVPARMIDKRQTTLEQGTAYRFDIGPVDPYDPFLGRYLVLNLEAAMYEGWRGEELQQGQTVYAVLQNDQDGFAQVRSLSMDPPGTRDYLKLRVDWQSGQKVRLQIPFSRYYLEENAAQMAWRIRRDDRRQPVPAYIVVRVLNGFGVLDELYFEDLPILDYMRKRGLWPAGAAVMPAPGAHKPPPVDAPAPASESAPAKRPEDPA